MEYSNDEACAEDVDKAHLEGRREERNLEDTMAKNFVNKEVVNTIWCEKGRPYAYPCEAYIKRNR